MTPRARRVLAIFLLVASSLHESFAASTWFARVWQVEEGLPADNVTGIAQTKDGFLWVATQSGLSRFDGVQFVSIRAHAERARPIIRAMLVDRQDQLWLAEEAGAVVRLTAGPFPKESEIINLTTKLARFQPLEMLQAGDQSIWLSDVDGLVCRIAGQNVTTFGENEGWAGSGPCSLTTDADGNVWFARSGRVGTFRDGKFVTLLNLSERNVQIKGARTSGIWVCAGDKLLKVHEGSQPAEIARLVFEPAMARATTLFEDDAGGLWVGTSASGLLRYNGTNVFKTQTSHGRIRTITEDREGNIWVGTDGGGLNRLRRRVIELEGKEGGLPFDTVRSATEGTNGQLWVVTQNGEVAYSDGEGWNTLSSTDKWPGGQATCVAADKQGVVWIGTYSRSLYRFENGRIKVLRSSSGLFNPSIRSLLADSKGNLWIAFSSSDVLQRYGDGKFQNFALPSGSRAIRAMAEDAAGNIWVANLNAQLLRVEGDKVIDETARTTSPHRPIRCLAGSRDGSLWIGYSSGGLGRLSKTRLFARIGTDHGLPDESICSVMPDNRGSIWMGSDHGIFQVNERELINVANGVVPHVRAVTYGRDDGLPSLQSYYGYSPGAVRCHDGRVLIPTHSGLAVIHPERVQMNRVPPGIVIENVVLDNQVIGAGIQRYGQPFPPGHRKLEINFTAPSFIEAKANTFRYRLDGWDEGWVDSGNQRKAIYPRLPAGNYHFMVTAANNAGVWNDRGASFSFSVQPFLWQTWWFRTMAALLFTSALFALVRFVSVRRLNLRVAQLEEENALQRERARIAQDIHDDLGARMTQISMLAERTQKALKEPDKAGEHVSQIATMSREGMKSLDEIVWAVNPGNDNLPDLLDYTGQYAVDFLAAAGIRCRLDFPDNPPASEISAELRHSLFMALKEALHNVAKHAHASEVHLRASLSNGKLEWLVADNGRGFDNVPGGPFADGLGNMRRRLTSLGGSCSVDGKPGEGTSIKFEVPL